MNPRPPFPPFDEHTAAQKVQAAALRKERWAFRGNRIAVRFQYECHDREDQYWRSYGNELWEFTNDGLMRRREASINDVHIAKGDRRIVGPRPDNEHGVVLPIR